jgi:hypothetical protein
VRFSGARGLCNEEIPSCAETATDLMNCRRSPQGKIRSGEGTRLKCGRTSSARQEVNKTGRAIQREQHTPRSAAVACAQHELNQQPNRAELAPAAEAKIQPGNLHGEHAEDGQRRWRGRTRRPARERDPAAPRPAYSLGKIRMRPGGASPRA